METIDTPMRRNINPKAEAFATYIDTNPKKDKLLFKNVM